MSEGVFLLPRNNGTLAPLCVSAQTFGTAGLVISAKPGCAYHMRVVNASSNAYYIQIHNKATAPINGDVPKWIAILPAGLDAVDDFGICGLYLSAGFSVALSTTPATLTLATANNAVICAQYTSAG